MADDDPLANLRKPTEEARVDLEHMPDAESGPSEDAPGFVVAGFGWARRVRVLLAEECMECRRLHADGCLV